MTYPSQEQVEAVQAAMLDLLAAEPERIAKIAALAFAFAVPVPEFAHIPGASHLRLSGPEARSAVAVVLAVLAQEGT